MQRLVPAKSLVVVVDVQVRLASAMPPARLDTVSRAIRVLLEAAQLESVPVLATEQYPKGLGTTVPAISAKLEACNAPRVEKLTFSALGTPAFVRQLDEAARQTVIVVGMETHVCVYQTVRDLVNRGLEVHVPIDAVLSRREADRAAGLGLCERAGAVPTTVEAVVFDWLERAGTGAFRAISKLLK